MCFHSVLTLLSTVLIKLLNLSNVGIEIQSSRDRAARSPGVSVS